MPKQLAVASGPIAFTDSDGKMWLIPLTALTFDNGALQVDALYNTADIKNWLQYLVKAGSLIPGDLPPPKPAMTITALDAGAAGNNIQVTFSNIQPDPAAPTDPAKTTFDATVTETDTYEGLSFDSASPSFIKTVLGTETTAGNKPGLVHIKDADTPSQPKAGTYQLTGGSNTAMSIKKVDGDPSGTAFQVEAKKAGKEGDSTMVTISNVNTTAKTFTLKAEWSQTATGLKLADLPDKLPGSGYEIKAEPPDGGAYVLPAPGPVALNGGGDAQKASTAKGIVLTS